MKFNLFGAFTKSKDDPPARLSPKWKDEIRDLKNRLKSQERKIERDASELKRELEAFELEVAAAAKRNDAVSCTILAKELVNSRKAHQRLLETKSQIASTSLSLTEAATNATLANSMADVSATLHTVTKAFALPQMNQELRNISKQLEKLGLVDELIEDTLQSTDPLDIEDAADAEVNEVVESFMSGAPLKKTDLKAPSTADLDTEDVQLVA